MYRSGKHQRAEIQNDQRAIKPQTLSSITASVRNEAIAPPSPAALSDRPCNFSQIGEHNLITELLLVPASCPELGHLFTLALELKSDRHTSQIGTTNQQRRVEAWGFLAAAERSRYC
ncbi:MULTISPECIES: hypothetical protein [Trichocoleus]|uniref:Uncharacterized protein n=1 Tax=Trichocoleus desertorum GB2-A4 TaxID=2933944 RepID=A0ABV0JHA5_9CYAN|nr:hypothetical protein [Trichocoleus sp. FACHB-46]MBD1865703.1 hypothetical protein [Trichocoleus sp. FACHB-46]